MLQADRALASIARRPAIRAAALVWIWITVLLTPVGATLHTLSHLRTPVASLAVAGTDIADPSAPSPREDHGAATHCHVCDEWQALDHVLPTAALPDVATPPAPPPRAMAPPMRVIADTPWILPRAPPARH